MAKPPLHPLLRLGRTFADGMAGIPSVLRRLGAAGAPPFQRLLAGASLSAEDGALLDLRGAIAPSGNLSASPHAGLAHVEIIELRKTTWRRLDLSRAQLRSFRFDRARIEGCRFDGADCHDWRLWRTEVRDCSFRDANLRDAALGGISEGGRNRYVRVDFSGADLRGTAHKSSDFDHCDFSGARLDQVDFQGSVFTDCRFQGELSEVMFYRHAFRGEQHPPNEMTGVDFSGARFRWVDFRGLDLHTVRWPEGSGHLQVHDWARTLGRMIEALRTRTDDVGALIAILEMKRKWAGPHQQVGIISRADVEECGDPELFSVLEQLNDSALKD